MDFASDEDFCAVDECSSTSTSVLNKRNTKSESFEGPQFYPALYIQRYSLAKKILQDHKIKSVVDFGCAECKIVHWLKRVETIEQIYLVDVDATTLQANMHIAEPLLWEQAVPRSCPLTITVLTGSAAQVDRRIVGCQAATLIEVIEHLEPDVLVEVTRSLFGHLQPSLAVITTPNADFNILFPDFPGSRHWDHKFEWTQEEYHCWCEQICKDYNYEVTYTGVGEPPEGKEHLGYCSQVAVFTRKSDCTVVLEADFVYSQIGEHVYRVDTRSDEEKLTHEVTYIVNSLSAIEQQRLEYDEQDRPVSVSVADIISWLSRQQTDWQPRDVMSCLENLYTLSDSRQHVLIPVRSYDFSSHSSDDDDSEDNKTICRDELLQTPVDEKWD